MFAWVQSLLHFRYHIFNLIIFQNVIELIVIDSIAIFSLHLDCSTLGNAL